jgi:hypothetical protein
MNKPVFGLPLGAFLGIFDGLTAWFTPAVRPALAGGDCDWLDLQRADWRALRGYFARKVHSVPLGVLFGLGVGMLLAYGIAAMPSATGEHYYFAIIAAGKRSGSCGRLCCDAAISNSSVKW